MRKAITGVIFFTVLVKLLGFVRELLLSYFFGATGISDAYLISQTIPGTLFQFVGTGLTTCFIPVYYKVIKEQRKVNADIFTNKIITIVFCFSTVVMGLVWSATSFIVRLFASGFAGETLEFAVLFTRIGICSLYFSTLIYVYNSYLQANNQFYTTSFAGILNSISIIIAILLGSKWNILALTVGSTLATAVQAAFLWIPVYKLGFRLHINFHWKDPNIKHFFMLMIPVIFGVSINELNMLVDRTVASQVAVGGISALTYANSLIMFVQGGFTQPIATVCYPKMTKCITESDYEGAHGIFDKATETILSVLLPITTIFLLYSTSIIDFLFGRGAFNDQAIQFTSTAVVFYSLGIAFMGVRELLSRYYYAFGDTKTPMQNAAIGMIINIVLNLTLSRVMGIGGLALATSVSALITTILMWKASRGKLSGRLLSIKKRELGKIFVGTLIMAGISKCVFVLLPAGETGRLFAAVFVGIGVYVVTVCMLKLEVAVSITEKVTEKCRIYKK